MVNLLVNDIDGKFAEQILNTKETNYKNIYLHKCSDSEKKFKAMKSLIYKHSNYHDDNSAELAVKDLELAYNRISNRHNEKQDNLIQEEKKRKQKVKDNKIVMKDTNKKEKEEVDTKNKNNLMKNWKTVVNEFKEIMITLINSRGSLENSKSNKSQTNGLSKR